MFGPFAAGVVVGVVLTLYVTWWPYRSWRLHRSHVAKLRGRWWVQLPEQDLPQALDHARRLSR